MWIYAELILPFAARLIADAACVLAASYFSWRLSRRLARTDAGLTAAFGQALLKLGAAERLGTAFERFLKKQESCDKIGPHKVFLSDDISIELGQVSRERENARRGPSSTA
jgi:hypothetical protein